MTIDLRWLPLVLWGLATIIIGARFVWDPSIWRAIALAITTVIFWREGGIYRKARL